MLAKMNRREFLKASASTGVILCMAPNATWAQEPKSIPLAKPRMGSGNTLTQALWKRMSTRQFGPDPLPVELLSNLLWAGFGINRSDGRRTAPSAMNWQETDIHVILADGAYVYDAKANRLTLTVPQDLRGLAGRQSYAREAPVNLIYVSDHSRIGANVPEDAKLLFSGFHAGAIAQNISLFCAAEGLATVVRAGIDVPALGKALKLRPNQKITLAQSVGYPKT